MSADVHADTSVVKALRRMRGPQTQRNRELGLLVFALLLSGAAITLVQLVVGWGQVAYAAHLAGGLAGYLLARRWRDIFVLPPT